MATMTAAPNKHTNQMEFGADMLLVLALPLTYLLVLLLLSPLLVAAAAGRQLKTATRKLCEIFYFIRRDEY